MCSWSHGKPLETHGAPLVARSRHIGSQERLPPNMMPTRYFQIKTLELYSQIVDGEDFKVA